MSLRPTIILALAVAGLSFVIPLAASKTGRAGLFTACVSFSFSIAWLVISVSAIRKYGKRGAWTLLGLLPALFWPLSSAAIALLFRYATPFAI